MNEIRSADTNQTGKPRAISSKTIRGFCVGVVGWFALHSLFWGAIGLIASEMGPAAILLVSLVFVPAPANIIVLALLLTRPARRWIVLGAFSAFVINSIGIILVAADESPLFTIFAMLPFFLMHRLGL